MPKKIVILYLNGLSKGHVRRREKIAIHYLAKYNIEVIPAQIDWHSDESFRTLLGRMVRMTNKLLDEHGRIVLVGSSAGGSLAINILGRIDNKRLSAVTLCSRLNLANLRWWDRRSLERMSHMHTMWPSYKFHTSVTYCSTKTIPALTKQAKKRVTIVKQWIDFVVPRKTMNIDGVQTHHVPAIGHAWGIYMAVIKLPKLLR